MHATHMQLGALSCTLVRSSAAPPRALVLLCHGYGASRADLVDLADATASRLAPATSTAFLFPEAPLSLAHMGAPNGRAWWQLDLAYLQRRQQMGAEGALALQNETFAGLPQARRQLRQTLELALQQLNLPYGRLLLGGFSQGAMLSTDLALSLEEAPAALVALSGTLIDAGRWATLAQRRRGLRVVQSHGRQDPVLPFAGAEALRDVLLGAGLDVQFLPFDGGHTVPTSAIAAVAEALREVAEA